MRISRGPTDGMTVRSITSSEINLKAPSPFLSLAATELTVLGKIYMQYRNSRWVLRICGQQGKWRPSSSTESPITFSSTVS